MENGQSHYSANKLEVIKMLWIDPRMRIDLQCVIVVRRIFKQTIERIEHLVGEKEEKFPEVRSERSIDQIHCCIHLERPP